MVDRPTSGARLAALRAMASPVRQEILSDLGNGPASAREIAARLGRSRQAVHFHIGALERAGLLRVREVRGTGREQERVYERGGTRITGPLASGAERAAAAKAAGAMLRLTQRELGSALRCGGGARPVAVRAKARLDERGEARLRRLIQEMVTLFRRAKGRNAGRPMLALTLVLTPAAQSKAAPRQIRKGGGR